MYARTARESIEHLLGLMKGKLIEAGIPRAQVRMRSGSFKIEKCAAAYDWVHEIFISRKYEIGGKALVACWRKSRPSLLGKDRPGDFRDSFSAGDYSC